MGQKLVIQLVSLGMIILALTLTTTILLPSPVLADNEHDAHGAVIPETDHRGLSPLGVMTADGGSPGYIIGNSVRDNQGNFSPGRLVDWRHGPQVHFIYSAQYFAGDPFQGSAAAWYEYTCFDPTVATQGVFWPKIFVQQTPLVTGGWFPNLDIDETGHAILAGETFDLPISSPDRDVCTYWDVGGVGNYGTFVPNLLPQALSLDPTDNLEYPKIEYQEYGGSYVTHVVVKEPSGLVPYTNSITYWRRVGGNPTTGGWTMQPLTGTVNSNQFDIAASLSGSDDVAVCWIEWPNWLPTGSGDESGQIMVRESGNAGMSWGLPYPITPDVVGQDTWVAWVDLCALYDTDGYLHVVYNAEEYDGSSWTKRNSDPSRILHWTNRVSGTYGGGTIRLVHMAEGLSHMCGQGRPWVTNTAKPTISQCDDKLYVVWQQYGDYDSGDTLDCADPTLTHTGAYMYNADLYMSVSLSLDGHLWDAGRNLTQSKTPGCDGSNPNNCDHDSYPSTARYGMNTATFAPTYWSNASDAFQVRDIIDGSYPEDDWYVDCIYVNDLMTEPAGHPDAPANALWTFNPIKWFRLPCTDPIIESYLYLIEPAIEYPHYWADAGQEKIVDVGIENTGNATLNISNFVIEMTVGDPGWLNVSPMTLAIPPGDTAYFQLTINAGGAVTPAVNWESIIADVIVHSDGAGGSEDTVEVNTIVGSLASWEMAATFSATQKITTAWIAAAPPGDFTFFGALDLGSAADNITGPVVYTVGKKIECLGGATGTYTLQDLSTVSGATHTALAEGMLSGLVGINPGPAHNVTQVGAFTDLRAGVAPGGPTRMTNYALAQALDPIVIGVDGIGPIVDPRTFDIELSLGAETYISTYASHLKYVSYVHDGAYPDPDDLLAVIEPGDTIYAITIGQDMGGELQIDVKLGSSVDWSFSHTEGQLESLIEDAITIVGDSVFFKNDLSVLTATVTVPGGTDNVTVGLSFESEVEEVLCCGRYEFVGPDRYWPFGYTGNTNCSSDGRRSMSDISRLIDKVYISKTPLCCYASGNTNGSWDNGACKINLSDITRLIDAIYISKELSEACMDECDR